MHFPFVRLEWRVKMAHANPSFTIRNPVNPVHPVSNIDWTGLREEQDYSPPASSVPRHFHSPKPPIPRQGYAGRWAHIAPYSRVASTATPDYLTNRISRRVGSGQTSCGTGRS